MKKPWILLIALSVVVATSVLFLFGNFGLITRANQGTISANGGEFASDASGANSAKSGRKPEDRPLPSVDVPLATVIDDLKRRADRGEANAACRLASEWTFCQGLQKQLLDNESMLRNVERRALGFTPGGNMERMGMSADTLERSINHAQAQVDRSRTQLLHCDGVAAPQPEEVTRYWRQAALAGHLPSMRNYAVGNAFRRNEILNNLPALTVYRQEAVRIAQDAVDRGDLRVAVSLAGAYSPLAARNGTYLAQLVEPNAVESLVLLYRINDVIERSERVRVHGNVRSELAGLIEDMEAVLSPQEILEAGRRAEKASPLAAGFRDLQGLFMVAHGFVADVPREECDLATWNKEPYPGQEAHRGRSVR